MPSNLALLLLIPSLLVSSVCRPRDLFRLYKGAGVLAWEEAILREVEGWEERAKEPVADDIENKVVRSS
jgi:hypothetical protein